MTHRFSVTLSFAPKRLSDRSWKDRALARNSDLQRIDVSSLIVQLIYDIIRVLNCGLINELKV